MPIDPSAQAVFGIITAPGVPPLDQLPPAEARQAYDGLAAFAGEPVAVARTEDLAAAGHRSRQRLRQVGRAGEDGR